MDQITAHLASASEPTETAPVEQLPKDDEYYLNKVREFTEDRLNPDDLHLPKYEFTLVGTFTLNEEGEVLSHTFEKNDK